jgi:hypothetical protein
VTGLFATLIIVMALLFAVAAFVLALLDRTHPIALLACAAILELMLAAFLVGGIVQMLGTEHDFARFEFVLYLIACLALVPIAIAWAWGESTRAGTVVIGIAFLVVPVLVLRVQQVWAGPVG